MSTTKGVLIINEFGNGFVNSLDKTIYIKKKDLNKAYHMEIVDIEYYAENGMYFGKVINYSLIGKSFVGLVYNFYKGDVFVLVPELKKNNLISINTLIKLRKNDWVRVNIISEDDNKLQGQFVKLVPNILDDIIEEKFNLNQIDPSYEIKIKEFNDICHTHIDQTDLDTFTIDPFTSRDCDDAFSIKKINDMIHIYVHISDVAHYINPSNPLFEKIISRGNTYYGSEKNWTMIPRKYADDVCSILPNKSTHVVTSEFIYDDINNKLDYINTYYSIIKSKNKYWYDLVDQNFNIDKRFQIIYNSSQIIKKGMNDLILVDETKSHEMVRYWMIHVNQIMCMEIKKLYRSNPSPQPISSQFELIKKYQELHNQSILYDSRENIVSFLKTNNNDNNKLCQFMVKCLLVKASYTTEDLSHYGIGISNYTHWTSPIRRASDLINHCLFKGYDINVASYLENINNCENTQDKIEAFILNYNNYKNLKIGNEHIYLAVILDIFSNSISVFIDKLDSKYTIHISKLSKDKLIFDSMEKILKNENDKIEYKLFQEISLVIDKVNFDSIEFSLKPN